MSISSRSLIILLLMGASVAACDKQSGAGGQDNHVNAVTSGEVAPDEVTPDEAVGNSGEGAAKNYAADRSKAGALIPAAAFTDDMGKAVTLTQFKGKPLLVNLWATWCAPCIAEMPQLDRIAGAYAPKGMEVLTISQDTAGADRVRSFFADKKFVHLKLWLDPETHLADHYATGVLPTSILYNARGQEVVRIVGAPDWEGKDMQALLNEAISGSQ